jgi:hypothetical protein
MKGKDRLRILVPTLVVALVLTAGVAVPAFATAAGFSGNLPAWQENITL